MFKLKPEKIKNLIVHHTATSRDRTTFEAVKRYHTKTKRWADIGYHWFITGDGKLWKGRDEQWVGAHCNRPIGKSMNFRSLGIALTGNFETEMPSKEQISTLERILSDMRVKYSIPRENVFGHTEVSGANTLCPGKNFLPYLRSYRKRTKKPEPEADNRKVAAFDEIVNILKKYDIRIN